MRIEGFYGGHVQGIALDARREYIYLSFTTCLVKAEYPGGKVVGSVGGLLGHLGCIALSPVDGRIWGSLEYKHECVGASILSKSGRDVEDGFYLVSFDGDRIDRMDMSAEADGIMQAAFLSEVSADYAAPGHRYGCSGIDGVTFAPVFGRDDGWSLYVAYGIYGDVHRRDNDHQILLRFDPDKLNAYARPLIQGEMHRSGPEIEEKLFLYTGNTTYGIQNLEYNAEKRHMLAAVYPGKKPQYRNPPMFFIDCSRAPEEHTLRGLEERGREIFLADPAVSDFPYGSTGMVALGGGEYLFSKDYHGDHGYGTDIRCFRTDAGGKFHETEEI